MQVMALFDNTRTLVQLASSSNQWNSIQNTRQEEEKFRDYLKELSTNSRSGNKLETLLRDETCPTQMALNLRLECYRTMRLQWHVQWIKLNSNTLTHAAKRNF